MSYLSYLQTLFINLKDEFVFSNIATMIQKTGFLNGKMS